MFVKDVLELTVTFNIEFRSPKLFADNIFYRYGIVN